MRSLLPLAAEVVCAHGNGARLEPDVCGLRPVRQVVPAPQQADAPQVLASQQQETPRVPCLRQGEIWRRRVQKLYQVSSKTFTFILHSLISPGYLLI